jgi:hypothetical protein
MSVYEVLSVNIDTDIDAKTSLGNETELYAIWQEVFLAHAFLARAWGNAIVLHTLCNYACFCFKKMPIRSATDTVY